MHYIFTKIKILHTFCIQVDLNYLHIVRIYLGCILVCTVYEDINYYVIDIVIDFFQDELIKNFLVCGLPGVRIIHCYKFISF